MSTQAEIIATPGDRKITVTIKKVYRDISLNIVATDFENPIFILGGAEGRDIDLNPYLITDSTKGPVGTMKDKTSIVIDNLENGKAYSVSYYQKGLENADTTLTVGTYKAVYPHAPPPAPEVYVGTTGEMSNNFYNGYRLHINLNDYDHTLPEDSKVDKVEYVFIRYTRLTGTDDERITGIVSLDIDNATDLIAINLIRTNGYYTFPDNTLVADAEYSFIVSTKSDGVSSPQSNPVTGLMKKVAQVINSFTLVHNNTNRNEATYTFNVNRAAFTNNDFYKLYRQDLSGETLIEDISSGRIVFTNSSDTSGNVTGTVKGTLGQIIRLRVEPYSAAKILGVERLSNSIMLEGLKNHMLEINLSDIMVKDGEGNATLVFRTSHRKDELPYESRNIDLASLSNDRFNLFLPNKTSRLSQKLTLADDGTASLAIYMVGKTATDTGVDNIFTLDASGYNAVYSKAATERLLFNSSSIKLLTASTVSKTFKFDVTTVKPPKPTINTTLTKFLENYISVRWSSTGVTAANAPTEYIVTLTSNTSAMVYKTFTITNGDEYYNIVEYLPKLSKDRTGKTTLNSYTVSVSSRNSAGESLADSLTDTLEDLYFPSKYLDNLRITEPEPRSTTATRNYEGKIKINKKLWGGAFEKLTITNNTEFGDADSTFSAIDISNGLIPTGIEDEYKFNFSLTGIKVFYLQTNAATLARTTGIALTARTSFPLFNTVVSIDKPRIKKVKFTIDNNKTFYEVRVDPQGSEVPIVSITPVPAKDAALPPNTNLIASYVKSYANGDSLYKIEFPFEVRTDVISDVTYGAESTLASNSRGTDSFGRMFGIDPAKYASLGAMETN